MELKDRLRPVAPQPTGQTWVDELSYDNKLSSLQNSRSPIWYFRFQDSKVVWCNNAALRLWDRTAEQIFSKQNGGAASSEHVQVQEPVLQAQEEIRRRVLVELEELELTEMNPQEQQQLPCMPFPLQRNPPKQLSIQYSAAIAQIHGVDQTVVKCEVDYYPVATAPGAITTDTMLRMLPIFVYMFDKEGHLLMANPSAMDQLKEMYGHTNVEIRKLLEVGLYNKPDEQEAIIKQCYHQLFENKEPFRIQQKRISRKRQGEIRWLQLEMWPIMPPATDEMCVLVCQYNITRSIERMRNFMQRTEILQAENHKLNRDLLNAKAKIGPGQPSLDTDTPIDKTLALLTRIQNGGAPPTYDEIQEVKQIIVNADHLQRPANLQEQLLKEGMYDHEVGLNLLQLLGDTNTRSQRQVGQSILQNNPDLRPTGNAGGATGQRQLGRKITLSPDDLVRLSAANATLTVTQQRMDADKEYVPRPLSGDMEKLLRTAEGWAFDPFKLAELTDNRPLSTLGFFVLQHTGLARHFGLNDVKLANFLRRIEDGYANNPYHNRTHAADVLQSMYALFTTGGVGAVVQNKLCHLAAYMSAIVHDFEHAGLNNDFLIKASDTLAIRYNDKSPLENHHLAGAFTVAWIPQCNFMEAMTAEMTEMFRGLMIDMVLATDMKQHFTILSQFQAQLRLHDKEEQDWEGGSVELNQAQLSLVLQMALKCCDVGHLATSRLLHKQWVGLLQEEFFRQGDLEQTRGLPVSPLMDRRKPGITRSQVGFFDIVALPLFRTFQAVFPRSQELVLQLMDNFEMWKEVENTPEP